MTSEEAIKHFEEDLEHIRQHLQEKDKAPEFYEEMKRWEKAEEMAIEALKQKADLKRAFEQTALALSRIDVEQETEIERDITRLENRMARIEDIILLLIKGGKIHLEEMEGWGITREELDSIRSLYNEIKEEKK